MSRTVFANQSGAVETQNNWKILNRYVVDDIITVSYTHLDVYKRQIINRVLNEQYSSKIDGLPGNDDLGTMGAWYVFACIGLYPEIPGVGGFTVNTPIFSSVKVHLKKGDMVIKGGSEKNIYIKSMKLNGKPYDSTWIDWDQLNNGATIEYTTSSKPDVKWGTKVTPPSFP